MEIDINEQIIEKKMEKLTEALLDCVNAEPVIELETIGMIIAFNLGEGLEELLKGYKKELKKGC